MQSTQGARTPWRLSHAVLLLVGRLRGGLTAHEVCEAETTSLKILVTNVLPSMLSLLEASRPICTSRQHASTSLAQRHGLMKRLTKYVKEASNFRRPLLITFSRTRLHHPGVRSSVQATQRTLLAWLLSSAATTGDGSMDRSYSLAEARPCRCLKNGDAHRLWRHRE